MSLLQALVAGDQENRAMEEARLQNEFTKGRLKALEAQNELLNLQVSQEKGLAAEQAKIADQFTPEQLASIQGLQGGQGAITQTPLAAPGAQAPNGVNLHAGLGSSTSQTLTQPEGTVQATVESNAYSPEQRVKPFQNTGLAPAFEQKLGQVAQRLEMSPHDLLQIMRFETGGTLDPKAKNPHSDATGLIQFLPTTAIAMGTSVEDLSKMSQEQQLEYVEKYLAPYKGKLGNLQDAYMAVLSPGFIGKSPETVMFKKGTTAYEQNKGLDKGNKGYVTVADATAAVQGHTSPDASQMVADASGTATPRLEQAQGRTQKQVPLDIQSVPQQETRTVDLLERTGLAYLRHGKGEAGVKLMQQADELRKTQLMAGFYQQVLASSKDPQMRAGAIAGLGSLMIQLGKEAKAVELLKGELPPNLWEMIKQTNGETTNIVLGQLQQGKVPDIGAAQQQAQDQKVAISQQQGAAGVTAKLKGEEQFKLGQPVIEALGDKAGNFINTQTGETIDVSMPMQQLREDVKEKRVVHLTKSNLERVENLQTVRPIFAQAWEHLAKVYGPGGAFDKLTPQDRVQWLGMSVIDQGLAQRFPELLAAQRFFESNISTIARAISGEMGAMSNQDIDRARQVLPNIIAMFKLNPSIGVGLGTKGVGPSFGIKADISMPDLALTAYQTMESAQKSLTARMRAVLGNKEFRFHDLEEASENARRVMFENPKEKYMPPVATTADGERVRTKRDPLPDGGGKRSGWNTLED